MALTINIPDTLRKAVEAASNGRNTVLDTAKGQPCYMSILAHADMATANAALGISRHPAFTVNGVDKSELFIGQHLGSSSNGEMVSAPGADPVNSITFDNAVLLARANGNGWHLMSNAEFSAVALYCYYSGFQPRGNTSYGRSSDVSTERGVTASTTNSTLAPIGRLAPTSGNYTNRTRTGSGPAAWRHDNTPFGIADLCGNVWEWQSGIRVLNGQIQVHPNNDAALFAADFTASSTEWKAIDGATGALVAPASSGTVKYASANSGTADYTLYRANGSSFEGMVNSSGANPVSAAALTLLKSLGLFPVANAGLGADVFYLNSSIEALPCRGGGWNVAAGAGVFALYCSDPRSAVGALLGARPAFVI